MPLIIRIPEKWRRLALPRNLKAVRPGTIKDDLIAFVDFAPTMQEMRRLHAEGTLEGPQTQYFEPIKPVEEFYDTVADPDEYLARVAKTTLDRWNAR